MSVEGRHVVLVPYEAFHVPKYHEWMKVLLEVANKSRALPSWRHCRRQSIEQRLCRTPNCWS